MAVIYKKDCEYCKKPYESPNKRFCGWKCYVRGELRSEKRRIEASERMKKLREGGAKVGFQRGELNPSKKPEIRKALSERMKGKKLSKVQKKKISRSMKKALENPELLEKWRKNGIGRILSQETRNKISMSHAKKATVSGLKHKLDALFSLYIRKKYADFDGFVKCFTCGKVEKMGGFTSIQCGHYVSRMFNSLRYSERNCHPQCRACNIFKGGNMDEYALRLVEKYGDGILKELNEEKMKVKQFTVEELQGKIAEIKEKLGHLNGN